MSNKGYEGKIGHGGSQYVPAPFQNTEKPKVKKLTGSDLRTGSASKKSGK